jgi:hypothetical protein
LVTIGKLNENDSKLVIKIKCAKICKAIPFPKMSHVVFFGRGL